MVTLASQYQLSPTMAMHHDAVKPTHFGSHGASSLFDIPAAWIVRNFYDRGEAVRYAVEQTGAFTIPRTIQQLKRTKGVTGEDNVPAAKEALARDLAADFSDTFAPGLIATLLVGPIIDVMAGTLVRHNIPTDTMHWYEQAANTGSRSRFYRSISNHLTQYTKQPGGTESIQLETIVKNFKPESFQEKATRFKQQWLHRLKLSNTAPSTKPTLGTQLEVAAQKVATKLGKQTLDIKLPVTLPNGSSRNIEMTLVELMRDLHVIETAQKSASTSTWASTLSNRLAKTRPLKSWQMIGNAVALGASLSIPFIIRMITRNRTGEDSFPGTEAIRKHISGESYTETLSKPKNQEAKKKERFKLFPYLGEAINKGNVIPTALTLGFFGVLGTMAHRRFRMAGLSMGKLKNWFQVYAFERGFPFTTVTQMELTYGMLCGFRLASSRDNSEFREAGIRDCILGWPLLTYGFEGLRQVFAKQWLDPALKKTLGTKENILLKTKTNTFRTTEEMTPMLLKRVKMAMPVEKAMPIIKRFKDRGTFAIAALSWSLMAIIEPQFSIRLTNYLETRKLNAANHTPENTLPPEMLGGFSQSIPNSSANNIVSIINPPPKNPHLETNNTEQPLLNFQMNASAFSNPPLKLPSNSPFNQFELLTN